MRAIRLVALAAAWGCARAGDSGAGGAIDGTARLGLGRAVAPQEIAALDRDVGPDGAGLPPGSGSATEGAAIFAQKCAACHGAAGQGMAPAYPALVGRPANAEQFSFGTDPKLEHTIGNYWPYATTVFDYVRRAMPQTAPGSLSDRDVYALTAYLLAANQVIPMSATLDATSLPKVQMPYRDRFVPDARRGGREVK